MVYWSTTGVFSLSLQHHGSSCILPDLYIRCKPDYVEKGAKCRPKVDNPLTIFAAALIGAFVIFAMATIFKYARRDPERFKKIIVCNNTCVLTFIHN